MVTQLSKSHSQPDGNICLSELPVPSTGSHSFWDVITAGGSKGIEIALRLPDGSQVKGWSGPGLKHGFIVGFWVDIALGHALLRV